VGAGAGAFSATGFDSNIDPKLNVGRFADACFFGAGGVTFATGLRGEGAGDFFSVGLLSKKEAKLSVGRGAVDFLATFFGGGVRFGADDGDGLLLNKESSDGTSIFGTSILGASILGGLAAFFGGAFTEVSFFGGAILLTNAPNNEGDVFFGSSFGGFFSAASFACISSHFFAFARAISEASSWIRLRSAIALASASAAALATAIASASAALSSFASSFA
jgi:hypothetical protein